MANTTKSNVHILLPGPPPVGEAAARRDWVESAIQTAVQNAGTGSVTSVGLSLPTIFNVTNSPVTASGTLTATLVSQAGSTFLAAPAGVAGVPTFRTITPGDIPTLNQNTTGSAATLTTARTINGTSFNGSGNITTANWGTARTVTIGSTGKSVNGSTNVTWTLAEIGAQAALGYTAENTANKGVANGYASLGADGKVPSNQLPSYVDDVLEATNYAALPATGETGKIYITIDDGKIFRWSGSAYVNISSSVSVADTAMKLNTARTIALSGAATGTATAFDGSVNITIPVTALNADNLTAGTVPDARLPNTVIKYGDILQPNNPFGGNKLYYNVLGNPLFLSDLRWSVSASNVSTPHVLFDGNYESQASIPAGTTGIVTLDFGGNYSGYPYGTFLLSCYHNGIPESISIRVYCNYAPQGIGWKTLTVTKLKDGASATIFAAYNPYYAIQQVEVTVNAATSINALITQMELVLDRPGGQAMPVFNKYANETAYKDINWASGTPRVNGFAVWHAGNFDPATKAATSHTHAATDITSGTLSVARSWALTGDVTSPAGSGATTLANSGVTAGTYTKVTVDAKGRVTTGASLAASDVPTLNQNTTGSAAKLTTARTLTIGNAAKAFDGTADVSWTLPEIGAAAAANSLYYVVGAGTTGVWTGTIEGLTAYYEGLSLRFKIGIAGGSTTTTLNINGLGAKTVYLYGTTKLTTHYPVGTVLTLTYSNDGGGCWYSEMYYYTVDDYRIRWNNNVLAGEFVHGYQLLLEGADGKYYPVTRGGANVTTNVVSTAEFRIGGNMLYYESDTDVAANAAIAGTNLYQALYTTSMEYWSNRSTTAWATAYLPIYLVGSINANGNFVLDNSTYTSFLTQTLPTTDDGKLYWQLGPMGNTSDAFRLDITKPIFEYKDGKLRLYVPEHTHAGFAAATAGKSAATGYWKSNAAQYGVNAATVTGSLVIKTSIPSGSSNMVRVVVRGYDYSANGSWTVECGGYFYSSGPTLLNHSVQIYGAPPSSKVRHAISPDGFKCIIIGDDTTVWKYPRVNVDAMVSFSGSAALADGWTASIESNTTTYTQKVLFTANQPIANITGLQAALDDKFSKSTANTITQPTVIAGELKIDSGGYVWFSGTSYLDMNNKNIVGVNRLLFADSGDDEGIGWAGGNGWRIWEGPDTLGNGSGNLQIVTNYDVSPTRHSTFLTDGSFEVTAGPIRVGSNVVWHAGNFNPATKADASHSHAATDITSGTLNVARSWALTGDVTSPAGSSATTIANGAVSLAKMASLAANSIIGNNTGAAATPIALTSAQVRAVLNVADGATVGATWGSNLSGVPAVISALGSLSNSSGVLTNNGSGGLTWAAAGGSGTVTSVGLSMPAGFSVTNSPVTASGTLTVSFAAGYQVYTTTEANKLSGIAAGATVGATWGSNLSSVPTAITNFGNLTNAAGLLRNNGSGGLSWDSSAYITSSGSISGNAGTATKLATSRTLTIGSTGKLFDGSGNVSWSLAEIGGVSQGGAPRFSGLYIGADTDIYLYESSTNTLGIRVGSSASYKYFTFDTAGNFAAPNGSISTAGALEAGRVYAGWDSGTTGSISCSNWFRSSGQTGIYFSDYVGGWYMTDSTYVRSYNNKAVAASDFVISSDSRLKVAVTPFVYRGRLTPVCFHWKHSGLPDFGFIADQVQALYPEAVGEIDGDPALGLPEKILQLSYQKLTAVLAYQVNRLEDENAVLRRDVDDLKEQLQLLLSRFPTP